MTASKPRCDQSRCKAKETGQDSSRLTCSKMGSSRSSHNEIGLLSTHSQVAGQLPGSSTSRGFPLCCRVKGVQGVDGVKGVLGVPGARGVRRWPLFCAVRAWNPAFMHSHSSAALDHRYTRSPYNSISQNSIQHTAGQLGLLELKLISRGLWTFLLVLEVLVI